MTNIPSPCPCCGAYSMSSTAQPSALLAVSDVLVVKALEQVGRRIVNGGPRSRRGQWSGRPFHLAHTVWPPDTVLVDRALDGAWDVVPAMLDAHGLLGTPTAVIVALLDRYARTLLMAGRSHDVAMLRHEFDARLSMTFPASPERAVAPR